MRDPRESKAWSITVAGYGEFIGSQLEDLRTAAQERMNGAKDTFKLLSFTMDDPATPDLYGRGFARLDSGITTPTQGVGCASSSISAS